MQAHAAGEDDRVTLTSETPTPLRLKPLIPLASVSVAVGIATALALPFMSVFLTTEIGASPVALGTFLLIAPLSSMLASTLVGRLSDSRAVRRNLMLFGAIAGTVGYGLFAVLRNYWVLMAVSVTLVAVASSLMPQMFAYARQSIERTGSRKGPLAISALRMLISVSWVAGPPVAAALVALTGFGGLFGATALFYGVIALITLRLPELGSAPPKLDGDSARPGLRGEIVFAFAAFVLAQGSVALSVMAIPLFVTNELHGTTGDAGLILGLCAALEIPLMIAFGALAVKMDLHRLVCFGAAFALAYHALVLASSSVWHVAVLQLIHALVISAVMGVGISYFQTLAPDRPGHASTLFSNTNTAGAMIAGPLLGAAQQFGFRTAYAMSLTMSVIALVFLVLARPKPQPALAT